MNMNPKDLIIVIVLAVLCLTLVAAWPPEADAHTVTGRDCAKVASIYPAKLRGQVRTTCVKLAAKHVMDHLCQRADLTPFQAIDCIWPAWGRPDAKRVAECESTASVSNEYARAHGLGRWARNNEYWGILQMGAAERARYGPYLIGSDARIQVRSAKAYWDASGRDYSPWECRP